MAKVCYQVRLEIVDLLNLIEIVLRHVAKLKVDRETEMIDR